MRNVLITLTAGMLALALTGCASSKGGGSFLGKGNHSDPEELATATTRMLAREYLPAKTSFTFIKDPQDPFGVVLVERLRAQGYEVRLQGKPTPKAASQATKGDIPANPVDPTTQIDQTDEASRSRPLVYVVDDAVVDGTIMTRVLLKIDQTRYSRAWVSKGTTLTAAGAWLKLGDAP